MSEREKERPSDSDVGEAAFAINSTRTATQRQHRPHYGLINLLLS
jgi:hypothetical protein